MVKFVRPACGSFGQSTAARSAHLHTLAASQSHPLGHPSLKPRPRTSHHSPLHSAYSRHKLSILSDNGISTTACTASPIVPSSCREADLDESSPAEANALQDQPLAFPYPIHHIPYLPLPTISLEKCTVRHTPNRRLPRDRSERHSPCRSS